MANTQNLEIVEKEYRKTLETSENTVRKEKLKIKWGGEFEFDAVVRLNNKVKEIHLLSTSPYKTKNDKAGGVRLFKIFHDAQMMLLTGCEKCVLAFVYKDFYLRVLKERENGRFFPETQVELRHWDLKKTLGIDRALELIDIIEEVRSKSRQEMGKLK